MHFDAVNPHFLDQVVASSDHHEITVSEDIVNAHGVKLLARGARVSADLYDRLARHKLSRPLETTLALEHALTPDELGQRLLQHVSATPWLASWLDGQAQLDRLRRSLATLPLTPAALNALTVASTNHPVLLQHALTVTAISAGLAQQLDLALDVQTVLYSAALLHDLGYLYLAPALWTSSAPLPPGDWRQLSAHPVIGQYWASECAKLSEPVAHAIGHHQERADGSGYPHQTLLGHQPLASQALATAEMVTGVLSTVPDPGRLRAALLLLPACLPTTMREAALQCADRLPSLGRGPGALLQTTEAMRQMLLRFGQALETLHELDHTLHSTAARHICERLAERLNSIQRAFTSAGLDMWGQYGDAEPDSPVWRELAWLVSETNWQTRQLARDLTRQTLTLPEADSVRFEPLVALFLALSDALLSL